MVSVTVASAIEGAALNNPAKLFGRRTSPSMANTLTTAPPTRKRITRSIICVQTRSSCGLARLLDQPQRGIRALAPQQAIRLALQPVIIHKENFQLSDPYARQVLQLSHIRIHVVGGGHRDQP